MPFGGYDIRRRKIQSLHRSHGTFIIFTTIKMGSALSFEDVVRKERKIEGRSACKEFFQRGKGGDLIDAWFRQKILWPWRTVAKKNRAAPINSHACAYHTGSRKTPAPRK